MEISPRQELAEQALERQQARMVATSTPAACSTDCPVVSAGRQLQRLEGAGKMVHNVLLPACPTAMAVLAADLPMERLSAPVCLGATVETEHWGAAAGVGEDASQAALPVLAAAAAMRSF